MVINKLNYSLKYIGQEYKTFGNEEQKNSQGLGLGMSICIQMINLMGNIFILKGPYEKYLIKSIEKIGTKIAFLLST